MGVAWVWSKLIKVGQSGSEWVRVGQSGSEHGLVQPIGFPIMVMDTVYKINEFSSVFAFNYFTILNQCIYFAFI